MQRGSAKRLPDAGGYEVWLLCVGWLDFEPGDILPGEPVRGCVNALLLRGRRETLLVDAGSGPADVVWPGAAELEGALAAAGLAPSDVDGVVLTHLDFDHAGGVLAGEWPDALEPAFPRVIVSEVDIDVWRNRAADESTVATRLVHAYEAAGRLELAADGQEFRPGLRLVSAPGHREGHCVLLIGDELVYGADVLHHAQHVEHPEWDAAFDGDAAQALATRREWIARLAEAGTPVAFSHVPELGRILPGPRWSGPS